MQHLSLGTKASISMSTSKSILLNAAFCDHTEIPGDTRGAHQVVLVSVAYSVQILWLHWEFVIQVLHRAVVVS